MSLKIANREEYPVTNFTISGRMTMGEGTSMSRNRMRELAQDGPARILVNMAGVSYIDSSAIGELVAAHTTITRVGGEMKLLNLGKRVHDLLEITKLCTVFEVFEDENAAIGSFAAVRAA